MNVALDTSSATNGKLPNGFLALVNKRDGRSDIYIGILYLIKNGAFLALLLCRNFEERPLKARDAIVTIAVNVNVQSAKTTK